ncbi:type VI secretion system baseplate subunit TssK [Geoalkalibacter halelectricus]|uniref:Type VI secretion system baseplate subunit TssK n=1 Tax=Geoalkalibacter halelectricus TaxID=2847045 RepID=A0ABY5ZT36_9BACT|nr:type VI secretion system baseplate subunit TssK [Geoalkalibacter halelectricus]MDO3379314.1 type VI secretion system baseplate subunit TssK [Geoalkalibacter halelectricus]UWZ81070.1 type VI secretion system baseplate subunit TssK [Geoalkalibacter halelectricus]
MNTDGLRKIVWAEGVFLGQQHFQQWDRYQEGVQALLARGLNPLAWGILNLRIDAQSLENGRLRIERCLALFPDGRLVSYDAGVDPPLMCELGGRGGESFEVYLCLPGNRQVDGISGYPGKGHVCAWQADYREIADEYDGGRSREVLLARPNLRLLSADQPRDAFAALPVARVLNEGDGSFRLLPEFIPPVARIGASARLESLVAGMIDLIGARLRILNERKAAHGGGAGEFAQADPLNFNLLQVLSGAWPLLLHFQHNPELHPEFLYRGLVPVLGNLRAFSSNDGGEIPRYRHEALETVFPPLAALVEKLMDVQTQQRSASLLLARESDCLWRAEGLSPEQLQRATLFLEVDHGGEDPNWITDFARQVKVGPRSSIELMVASALPGVRLVHTQRPPAQMPVRSGCEYFRLEQRGDFWSKMLEEGSVAVFVTHPFAQADLALVRVQE